LVLTRVRMINVRVLVINAGSSSLKLSVVEDDDTISDKANFRIDDRKELEANLHNFLNKVGEITLTAHRIVHGGTKYRQAIIVDKQTRAELEELSALAPLHNPVALKMMDLLSEILPSATTAACFDTGFHSTLSPEAFTYAIPKDLAAAHGIRRFGFHGLSCAWSSKVVKELLPDNAYQKLIVCHIGAGVSITAVLNGQSVNTTMGYTPLEGLVMATRSGSIDPGIIIYLLKHGYDVDKIEEILDRTSGLTALVPGSEGNMLYILDLLDKGNTVAQEAMGIYTSAIASAIASLSVSLGGLGSIVFTGGVGEGSSLVRKYVAEKIHFLGLSIDNNANSSYNGQRSFVISSESSAISALVVAAQEDLIMAEETRNLIKST